MRRALFPILTLLSSLAAAAEPDAALSAKLLADAEVVHLDGKRVKLADELKPVTVLFLWTSLLGDPAVVNKAFDQLARHHATEPRVRMISVSIDQVKQPDDLAVVKELVAPAGELMVPVVVDTGFKVVSFAETHDYQGKVPSSMRAPLFLIVREGKLVHRGYWPPEDGDDALIKAYSPIIEAELKQVAKPSKRRAPRRK